MGFFTKMFGAKEAGEAPSPSTTIDFPSALALQLSGKRDQALEAYDHLAAVNPDDRLAPFFAASILAGDDQIAEAAGLLRELSSRCAAGGETISRAVALDLISLVNDESALSVPAVGELVVSFGERLKQEGFVQESAVCFEIAAGLQPDHANVLHKLGDTLHDLGAYEYAEKVLAKALELAPNHWGSLYTCAVLLQDQGRFEEAIGLYERAIALYPDHAKCRNNYGAALMLTGRLEEALAQCEVAAQLAPSFPLSRVNLGNIHLLRREYDTARDYFAEALTLDENLAPAYFGLGAVEQSCGGDPARARELYLKAIELNPENPQFHQALGSLLANGEKILPRDTPVVEEIYRP
jgi:tetratricopeptide (TPR) repeat protein